jgi:hypothetical protein
MKIEDEVRIRNNVALGDDARGSIADEGLLLGEIDSLRRQLATIRKEVLSTGDKMVFTLTALQYLAMEPKQTSERVEVKAIRVMPTGIKQVVVGRDMDAPPLTHVNDDDLESQQK